MDPANAFFGFRLGFFSLACLDAREL